MAHKHACTGETGVAKSPKKEQIPLLEKINITNATDIIITTLVSVLMSNNFIEILFAIPFTG